MRVNKYCADLSTFSIEIIDQIFQGQGPESGASVCRQSSLMGPSLTVPIRRGRLALGTWQGLYLNEHRNYGGPRSLIVTMQGQRRAS